MNNINTVKDQNLCIQCGICAAACPKKCIEIKRNGYNFFPYISDSCINCGICLQTCPINNFSEYNKIKSPEKYITGNILETYTVQAKNSDILANSTSGGFITQMIKGLLSDKLYDCAFLIDDYKYEQQLSTKIFTSASPFNNTQKSRYLTVSHTKTCEYMLHNPNKKIIIVATGCVISAILNFIRIKKLPRENYLLLGLFCDKTMNYGVVEYFKKHPKCKNKQINKFFFRDKKAGNWPGNIRIEFEDSSYINLPNTERMEVKDYFELERCLYCLDKLNHHADISIGDNYINKSRDIKGANSIIIRTNKGKEAFNTQKDSFIIKKEHLKDLLVSQNIKKKCVNLTFWNIKQNNLTSIPSNIIQKYKEALNKIEISKSDNLYSRIQEDIQIQKNKKNKVIKKIKFLGLTVFSITEKNDALKYSILGVIKFRTKK